MLMTFADALRLNVRAVRRPNWPPGCHVEIHRDRCIGFVRWQAEAVATPAYLRGRADFAALEVEPVELTGDEDYCGVPEETVVPELAREIVAGLAAACGVAGRREATR
jgi:hypothetical protein